MHYYNAVVLWASCLNKTLDQYPDLRNVINSKPSDNEPSISLNIVLNISCFLLKIVSYISYYFIYHP